MHLSETCSTCAPEHPAPAFMSAPNSNPHPIPAEAPISAWWPSVLLPSLNEFACGSLHNQPSLHAVESTPQSTWPTLFHSCYPVTDVQVRGLLCSSSGALHWTWPTATGKVSEARAARHFKKPSMQHSQVALFIIKLPLMVLVSHAVHIRSSGLRRCMLVKDT